MLGVLAGALGVMPVPDVNVQWRIPLLQDDYVSVARIDAGRELVLVVVGSSGCGWSNHASFRDAVRSARAHVQSVSQENGIGFATLGVAQDNVVARGVEHLEWLGPFDEIATGRGWGNAAFMDYVYGEFPGGVEDARVLVRNVGLSSIQRWVDRGSPVAR